MKLEKKILSSRKEKKKGKEKKNASIHPRSQSLAIG